MSIQRSYQANSRFPSDGGSSSFFVPMRVPPHLIALLLGTVGLGTTSCASDDVYQPLGDAGPPPVDDAALDAAVPACLDAEKAATFEPSRVVVGRQTVCAAGDASGFYDACVAAAADVARCQAFLNAHTECVKCLAGASADASGRFYLPALLQLPSQDYIPNVPACAAVALGNAAACGVAYVNAEYCTRSACDACPVARFGTCIDSAEATVCAAFVPPPNGECGLALAGGKATIEKQCLGTAARETFLKVAAVLCE